MINLHAHRFNTGYSNFLQVVLDHNFSQSIKQETN